MCIYYISKGIHGGLRFKMAKIFSLYLLFVILDEIINGVLQN